MVTRNRHDGTNSPEWWDDLPLAVRQRFTDLERLGTDVRPEATSAREPYPYRPRLLRDLSRLAVMFLFVALANLVFLLVALSFLSGSAPRG